VQTAYDENWFTAVANCYSQFCLLTAVTNISPQF